MKKIAACALLCAALGGCVTMGANRFTPPTQIAAPFDAAEAKKLMEPGKNKIVGSALMRQQGGGVVTCAGNRVTLFPALAYTEERMAHMFGSGQKGFAPTVGYSGPVRFEPDPPEFTTALRESLCDAQGMFEFDAVAEGDFYVSTSVKWSVGYARQGGVLLQRVKVAGGETKKIVLTP